MHAANHGEKPYKPSLGVEIRYYLSVKTLKNECVFGVRFPGAPKAVGFLDSWSQIWPRFSSKSEFAYGQYDRFIGVKFLFEPKETLNNSRVSGPSACQKTASAGRRC